MSEEITVRAGTPQDLDQVMALAQMMHDEIGITALNPARILPEVWGALNLDGGIMGLIGEPGGPLEAGLLLRMGTLFYSDETVLEDKGLFVQPEFRTAKGGRGGKLIDFAKHTADALGLPLVMGIQNDVEAEGKMRLYTRKFGQPIGALFLYRPPQSEAQGAPSTAEAA